MGGELKKWDPETHRGLDRDHKKDDIPVNSIDVCAIGAFSSAVTEKGTIVLILTSRLP